MRVLFDVRYASFQHRRGIGNYVKGLVGALAQNPGVRLDLMDDRAREPWPEADTLTPEALRATPDNHYDFLCLSSYFPDCWAQRADRLETILPYDAVRTCRAIVGVGYDLIPLLFPDIYLEDNESLRSLMELGVAIASKISRHSFALSQSTADDFVKAGICAPDQVTVIGGGIDPKEWAGGPSSPARTNRIVYLGGDNPRKNLEGALRGFAEFRTLTDCGDAALVVTGYYSAGSLSKIAAIASATGLRLGADLILPGEVPRGELVALLRGARASMFPSLYEGLGLPILESYAAGPPVAASNTSAMRELVPARCQFDPRDYRSIGEAIRSIVLNESVRAESLAFGRGVLERHTWPNAAAKMVDTLARIAPQLGASAASRRIAVFSCTPPDESGIANTSARVFKDPSIYDIFTDISSPREKRARMAAAELSAGRAVDLFPIAAFRDVHELSPFSGCLFVLGNSHHNLSSLEAAIQSRGSNLKRCAYIHDGALQNLWFWYCKRNIDRLVQLFSAAYNCGDALESFRDHHDFLSAGYYGVRPLAVLAGIEHFIVNSQRAKRIIERDLAPDIAARIDVAYLPINRIDVGAPAHLERTERGELIIGSFGIPGRNKGTFTVLAAAEILRKKMKVRVLLAGWYTRSFVENRLTPRERDNVIVVDSPSNAELFGCMKWADVAVQLREKHFGESSGVVVQLIGVGKKPIVSRNLISEAAEGLVIPAPNDIGPQELAELIENSIGRCDHDDDLSRFSSESLAGLVRQLMLSQ